MNLSLLLQLSLSVGLALALPAGQPSSHHSLQDALQDRAVQSARAKRAGPPRLQNFNRALRSFKELEPDPNLQDLSTADLYRLLEVLDIMEGKKTAKISPKELKTLEYLMEAYQQ